MARPILSRVFPAALAALSAAACASVEPARPHASAGTSTPTVVGAPVRANAPIPNPPEPGAAVSPVRKASSEAVARALGVYKIGKPYQVAGVWYVPAEQPDYDVVGSASWYGDAFHGKPTANGEFFDMHLASAAHATLPLPCIVEVTNLDNDRTIQVRVNDRGPFKPGRIIDVSRAAAEELGFVGKGLAKVRVRYVGPAPRDPFDQTPPTDRARERPLVLAGLSAKSERRSGPAPKALPSVELIKVSESPSLAAPAAKPNAQPKAKLEPKPKPKLAPETEPQPKPATILAASGGGFAVQAGSFANKGNAERAARTLGAIAPAQVHELQRESGPLYRVLVGAWPVRDGAAGALAAVALAGFPDARIVSGS